MSSYKQLRGTESPVRRSLLALLNAIFANVIYANAGQQASGSPREDISESETFFSRAQQLLSPVVATAPNIETGTLYVVVD